MKDFRSTVLDIARRYLPEYHFESGADEDALKFGAYTLSLTSLRAAVKKRSPRDRELEICRWLEVVKDTIERPQESERAADKWDIAKPLLRPKLMSASLVATAPDILHCPYSRKAVLAFGIDFGTFDQFVFQRHLDAWGVPPKTVEAAALENLEVLAEAIHLPPENDGNDGVLLLEMADAYDASRMILPGFRERLLKRLGPRLFAGIPGRDVLAVWAEGTRDQSGLIAWVRAAFKSEPYPITDEIFFIMDDGVRMLSDAEADSLP